MAKKSAKAKRPTKNERLSPEVDQPAPLPKEPSETVVAAEASKKVKKLSALNAAARVLAEAGQPMTCKEMIEAMTSRKLWSSPNGATPEATLYSAILRELKTKGDAARFVKSARGKFAFKAQA